VLAGAALLLVSLLHLLSGLAGAPGLEYLEYVALGAVALCLPCIALRALLALRRGVSERPRLRPRCTARACVTSACAARPCRGHARTHWPASVPPVTGRQIMDIHLLMTLAVAGAIGLADYVEAGAVVVLFAVAEHWERCSTDKVPGEGSGLGVEGGALQHRRGARQGAGGSGAAGRRPSRWANRSLLASAPVV
jgi:hypothetical protein